MSLNDSLTVLFAILYDALISLLLCLWATAADLLPRLPKHGILGLAKEKCTYTQKPKGSYTLKIQD
jgi:hypothetical protein